MPSGSDVKSAYAFLNPPSVLRTTAPTRHANAEPRITSTDKGMAVAQSLLHKISRPLEGSTHTRTANGVCNRDEAIKLTGASLLRLQTKERAVGRRTGCGSVCAPDTYTTCQSLLKPITLSGTGRLRRVLLSRIASPDLRARDQMT